MKKIMVFITVIALLSVCASWIAQAENMSLEAIMGSGGSVVAENFSTLSADGNPMFLDKSYFKNDTKSVPGWGMVAESSEIRGIEVSDFGDKEYSIPLKENQLQKDVGLRIHGTAEGTKNAAIDAWNIPLDNIRGAEKYRIEYNVYIHNAKVENPAGLITSLIFYAPDVPGVDKVVGVVGFRRAGTVVKVTDANKNKQSELKDENGNSVTFKNDAWQHVVVDVDAKNNTYTFWLNGTKLLENEKFSGIVNLNAESGTYRVRLSYTPFAGDTESFVIFDDLLFAKYVQNENIPTFTGVENGGAQSGNAKAFSGITQNLCFKNTLGVSESVFKLYENGKEVQASLSESNGVLKVAAKNGFSAHKSYVAEFDRFTSADGKTFMAEDLKMQLYCHTVFLSNVKKDSVDITSSEKTDAVLVVTKYNQKGEMTECICGDILSLEAGKTQKVALPEITLENGEYTEISVVESVLNPRPLCAAIGGAK